MPRKEFAPAVHFCANVLQAARVLLSSGDDWHRREGQWKHTNQQHDPS